MKSSINKIIQFVFFLAIGPHYRPSAHGPLNFFLQKNFDIFYVCGGVQIR